MSIEGCYCGCLFPGVCPFPGQTALHNAIINDKETVTMDDVYFALEVNKYKKES